MAVFVDTNILLYSVSSASVEQDKRAIAVDILNRQDCVLSVQVLQEFYVQATGPKPAFGLTHDLAADFIKVWMRFRVEPITPGVMLRALDIKRDHKLSYWDSAVIAAVEQAGCDTLLSEDMAHGQKIGRVLVHNPFL